MRPGLEVFKATRLMWSDLKTHICVLSRSLNIGSLTPNVHKVAVPRDEDIALLYQISLSSGNA